MDQYLLSIGHSAANLPHATAVVNQRDREMQTMHAVSITDAVKVLYNHLQKLNNTSKVSYLQAYSLINIT